MRTAYLVSLITCGAMMGLLAIYIGCFQGDYAQGCFQLILSKMLLDSFSFIVLLKEMGE